MNLVLPEGARKLGGGGGGGGGRRGCSRRGTFVHALLCSTTLLTFVSKYSDFFTYDTTHNLLAGICNHERKHVWLRRGWGGGGGGGGGNCCQRGGISYAMGGGGGGGGQAAGPHPQGYA